MRSSSDNDSTEEWLDLASGVTDSTLIERVAEPPAIAIPDVEPVMNPVAAVDRIEDRGKARIAHVHRADRRAAGLSSSRPPARHAPLAHPPGFSNGAVEGRLSRHVAMIDAHKPAAISLAPPDTSLFHQQREPAPEIAILRIRLRRGMRTRQIEFVHGSLLNQPLKDLPGIEQALRIEGLFDRAHGIDISLAPTLR
ncbi:hypothetical protein [Caballeronia ptereochthonis]|uniref:hypothetical protein n=1 Tax=Caballeronia ptereochthonis TaxID=1777144 RepID=UPI00135C9BD8|nr:hypothetical protein [Caballeronia ptereochthonis]